MMARSDIEARDVFISWTSADKELKDTIKCYLESHNFTVTDSEHDCAGDFRTWSYEAAQSCMVFLSLYTENTVNKTYVELELKAVMELDDWQNRCVPVVSDLQMFQNQYPALAQSESTVIMNGRTLTDRHLEEIKEKVQKLLVNRMVHVYREKTLAAHLRLESPMCADKEVKYDNLYVHRCVQAEDGTIIEDAKLIHSEDVLFLLGAGGTGKSCYTYQLRRAADADTLMMALPCRKLVGAADLESVMYNEFVQRCAARDFYSPSAFRRLLAVSHLCLVLDGMDEIATEGETRAMVELVRTYYEANAQQTTLLFTGRNRRDADYLAMNGQQPKIVSLRAMEEPQMRALGDNLMSVYHRTDKSEAFFTNVREMPEDIANNPLLVTGLARIYAETDEMPRTVIEILDMAINLTLFSEQKVVTVPNEYREMVSAHLPRILAAFAAERYRLLSAGKDKSSAQILARVLKEWYPDDARVTARAEFLANYLHDRGILVNHSFSHKMLLEYYTAMQYCSRCFDEYDDLVGVDALRELFSHYADPYWSVVLEMFLSKADVLTDADNVRALYEQVTGTGITEFTLLFDNCRKLLCHREVAQQTLVRHILQQSAAGTFPPYGPLFWYVPEYDLYVDVLTALATLTEEACYSAALALVRDVCWIFGRYNTAAEVSAAVNGAALWAKSSLTGVRKGLCELFYLGATAQMGGEDVYPRCFNLAEVKEWKEKGYGVWGRMTTPFADELGLYAHEMYSELGGEYIGIVADAYCPVKLENVLPRKSCQKLSGLFYSNGEETAVSRLAINDAHVKAVYYPENMQENHPWYKNGVVRQGVRHMICLQGSLGYFYDRVVVPAHVTEIGAWAFEGCSSLKEIHIPDGVTTIGEWAFARCDSLTSVYLPDSVTEIGEEAFRSCVSLSEIHIPNSVTTIGTAAFYACTSLTSIHLPESVTEIEENAFGWCTSLKRIENCPREYDREWLGVADGCELVYRTYRHKGTITNGTLVIPEGTVAITDRAYARLSDVVCVKIPYGVTSIGDEAFEGCRSLKEIHLPDSVETIGDGAFRGCRSLTAIRLPNGVTKIGDRAFLDCRSLKEIRFPDSVETIGEGTFRDCQSLTAICLPDSVTTIGDHAFSRCHSLKEIHIPDSVTEIGAWAFEGCSSLKEIHIPAGVTNIKFEVFKGCRSLAHIHLSDSVTKMEACAFEGCNSLTEIRIPDSVTEIGWGTFFGCSSLKRIENCPRGYDCDKLGVADDCELVYRTYRYKGTITNGTLVIPEGTIAIEDRAYAFLADVACVKIPDSVTKIGEGAFEGCRSLKEIHIPDSVTEIGRQAFYDCTSLTSIHLPDSMTEIERWAFVHCTSLREIYLPDSVKKIGDHAFSRCHSLKQIHIPDSVTEIGNGAFCWCSALQEICIPDGVTEIGANAFEGCRSLTSIHIPDSVTSIGDFAFKYCRSLKEIHLPDSVTEIGACAFEDCCSLVSIRIPAMVTGIADGVFASCTSLMAVTIPYGVRWVGRGAFIGCTGLTEITLSRRFEDHLSDMFPGVDLSKVTIHWL